MTAPDFSHLVSTSEPLVEPQVGPDAGAADAAVADTPPFENVKVGGRKPPRSGTPRSTKSVFGKKSDKPKAAASSVRQLTKADAERLSEYYVYASMALMPFRPATAQAVAQQADDCAEAWMEFAQKNVGARRVLVKILEGGAWGKIVAAHVPILLTLIPPGFMESRMSAFMGGNGEVPPDHPENIA